MELARAPGQVERVDRQAVAAHPGTGLEAHEPVGLGRGRVDDLPDVDSHPLGEDRQLVDERDVDRAEDVLEQLGHLGGLGRRDPDDVIADAAVELLGALGAGRRDPADHLGRVAQRVVGAPGSTRSGEKARLMSSPTRSPDASSSGTSRSRVVPGYVVDSSTISWPGWTTCASDLAAASSGPEVGLAVLGQRGRDADQHRVGLREVGVAVGRPDLRQHRLQPLGRDVLDVGVAVGDRRTPSAGRCRARRRAHRPRQTPPPAATRRIQAQLPLLSSVEPPMVGCVMREQDSDRRACDWRRHHATTPRDQDFRLVKALGSDLDRARRGASGALYPQSALAGLNSLPRGTGPGVSALSRGADGSVPQRWSPVNQVRSGRKQP